MPSFAYFLADLLRTAVGSDQSHRHTVALIAAAGTSTRMGGDGSKLLLPVDGIPVLAHTLKAYEAADTIDAIILIARRADFDAFRALAEQYKITKLKKITEGGNTRQESVLRGLAVLPEHTAFVAIADGARCLITPAQIDCVNRTAYRTGAATAGCPAIDTVKLADKKGRTLSDSPDRSAVWMAQTPQTFSVSLYRAAAYHAAEQDTVGTDDNALVEAIGRGVTLVDCGRENLKITTPQDICIATAILKYRKEQADKEDT